MNRLIPCATTRLGLLILCAFISNAIAEGMPDEPVPLTGDWLVAVPAGFDQPQTITHLEGNRYLLGRLNHAGVYRLEGDRLIIDQPRDKRLTESAPSCVGSSSCNPL